MKNLFTPLCCLFLTLLPPTAFCASLNLSKTPQHYAQEMEFYYLKPRPEMLPAMLAAFERGHLLANAEKRMFVAAFIAALSAKNQVDLQAMAGAPDSLGRDSRLTLAWAAHLSGRPENTELLQTLLGKNDDVAASQINGSPAPLAAWDPAWEKSVLNMYWAAFMATGDNIWLDKIIKTALGYARGLKGGSEAAATLYDYAPRHASICQRLREVRETITRANEKDVIDVVLKNAEKTAN